MRAAQCAPLAGSCLVLFYFSAFMDSSEPMPAGQLAVRHIRFLLHLKHKINKQKNLINKNILFVSNLHTPK